MHTFEVLLSLFAACVALALLALRLDGPLAVVLVIGGMMLALVPGLPAVNLDLQLALALFLPPLLQRRPTAPTGQPFASTSAPSCSSRLAPPRPRLCGPRLGG